MPRSPEPMRHVPEEELHAYLDQALSRSQCVEIEHHLSECLVCRAERDAIAALRDRTTALLLAATPRRIRPRPFTHLATTHVQRTSRRTRLLQAAAWAASMVAAIGLGWGLHQWSGRSAPPVEAASIDPVASTPATKSATLPERHQIAAVAPPSGKRASTLASTPVTPKASAADTGALSAAAPEPQDSAQPAAPPRPTSSALASLGGTSASGEPVLPGVWRTVTWTAAQDDPTEWVPRVDGVPVVQVKQRQAPLGGRPITLVTQQLANGEMISTVEGPATEVAALLSQQPGQSASAELQDMGTATRPLPNDSSPPSTPPSTVPRTLAIFGSAPSDSLKAFMLRVK